MIYYKDRNPKKGLHVLEADIIKIKQIIVLMSLAEWMHFYRACST